MGRTDVRVAVIATVAFTVLAVLVAAGWSPLIALDQNIADRANTFAMAHPAWVETMKFWTTVAGPLTWRILIVVLSAVLLLRRDLPAAAFALTAITVGGLLNTALKVLVDRARPVIPHPYANAAGMAFPSGHASTTALACGILLVLALPVLHGAWRALAWAVAVAVPLFIGYTRIGLDVHWTTDVVGGWLLAIAVVAAARAVWYRPAVTAPAELPRPGEDRAVRRSDG